MIILQFTKVNRLEDSVIDEHKLFLLKHRIKFDEDNIIYSIIYYVIDQNIIKSQPELDIITSGSGRSLQQLSVYLVRICFKFMLHSAENRSIYGNKFQVEMIISLLIKMNLF